MITKLGSLLVKLGTSVIPAIDALSTAMGGVYGRSSDVGKQIMARVRKLLNYPDSKPLIVGNVGNKVLSVNDTTAQHLFDEHIYPEDSKKWARYKAEDLGEFLKRVTADDGNLVRYFSFGPKDFKRFQESHFYPIGRKATLDAVKDYINNSNQFKETFEQKMNRLGVNELYHKEYFTPDDVANGAPVAVTGYKDSLLRSIYRKPIHEIKADEDAYRMFLKKIIEQVRKNL